MQFIWFTFKEYLNNMSLKYCVLLEGLLFKIINKVSATEIDDLLFSIDCTEAISVC